MDFRDTKGSAIDMGEADVLDAAEKAGTGVAMGASSVDELALIAMAATQAAAAQPADVRDSKTVEARRFTIVTDASRDALLTDFGKETLDRPLSAAGREAYQDLFARVAALMPTITPTPSALRLHLEAVVHARDAGAVERRHGSRPADLVLS
jgi:ribonucleoside-diphosphate reductase alpha chain